MDAGLGLLTDLLIIVILLLGVRQFAAVSSARSGNLAAVLALLLALGTVAYRHEVREPVIVVGSLAVGGLAGWLVALRVNMIQIPAMVAFQHGAGGIAAFLVSFVELTRNGELTGVARLSGILGVVVGAATFSGSMVATARLAGIVRQSPTILPKHRVILAAILALVLCQAAVAWTLSGAALVWLAAGLLACSTVLGVVFAMRIGGADMPVLISFLNATAGLAAALCGIVIQNRLLIACGATVAASGSLLTQAMCEAMNRRLFEVFVPGKRAIAGASVQAGDSGAVSPTPPVPTEPPTSPERSPLVLAAEAARAAGKVILIPGYGMALAHAQFEVVQLANRLRQLGKEVKFAVHPIAGRLPGHMHVLLAEGEADPDSLFDLPEIDREFPSTDLAIIVGACDVVNPAAIQVEGTPISGMPILSAHEARRVAVFNLDERPGYSGVANPLYASPKAILVFGDAKASLQALLHSLA